MRIIFKGTFFAAALVKPRLHTLLCCINVVFPATIEVINLYDLRNFLDGNSIPKGSKKQPVTTSQYTFRKLFLRAAFSSQNTNYLKGMYAMV